MERILIIEDEDLAAEKLQMLINKIDSDIKVVAKLATIEASVKWLANNSADLIFLDINLADGISFEIFEQIDVEEPIIFTTAYDQYAIRAFKQNSLDYILKPVTEDELRASISKYRKLKKADASNRSNLQALLSKYLPVEDFKKRILVTYGGKSKSIEVSNAAYLYAYDKGVYLTTFDNHSFLIDETLDTLEGVLNPQHFYRLNRKFIINIKSITEIHKFSTRRLKVDLNPVPKFDAIVPSDRITAFKEWLNS